MRGRSRGRDNARYSRGRSRDRRDDSSRRRDDTTQHRSASRRYQDTYADVVRALRDLLPQGAPPRDVYGGGSRRGSGRAQPQQQQPRRTPSRNYRPAQSTQRYQPYNRDHRPDQRPRADSPRRPITRPQRSPPRRPDTRLTRSPRRYSETFPPPSRADPTHTNTNQTNATSGPRSGAFQSDNPDFRLMVRYFNNGARLQHAANNWQQVPVGVQRAVDKVAQSVKPPLADDALQNKIRRAADQFAYNLQCAVSDHVTSKYTSTTRALAQLDPLNRNEARAIARRQILRSNTRVSTDHLDGLLSSVGTDIVHNQEDWRRVGRRGPPQPPPPQADTISTQNRFAALAYQATDNELPNAMEAQDTEVMHQTHSKKRTHRSSPPLQETALKRACAAATFKEPTPLPQRAPPTCPSRGGSGTPLAVREEVVATDSNSSSGNQDDVILVGAEASGIRATSGTHADVITCPEGSDRPVIVSGHPGELAPLTSLHLDDLATPGYVTPMPSPRTEGRAIRCSMFAPRDKDCWSIPEILPDEEVLLITDSNGSLLARHTPSHWRVAGYRGAYIYHVNRLIEKYPIPPQVKLLIVAIGLNDRVPHPTAPIINSVTRLRELLLVQDRHVVIVGLPQFRATTAMVARQTSLINGHFRDLLSTEHTFVDIPESMPVTDAQDMSHFSLTFAAAWVRHLQSSIAHLN